eukprot:gnl/MRDRNA2_/MRDRNA2_32221_c0_seq1.p1 gnl/MRDRNA2_/MRDRNA2_32221_c0~~gnl/MRDRNA2_/MRDRNA2_32221_c0_seq1.p1  ORF type:complete len:721 (+),score=141.40 gnl/MRDRNA2_/MRDRNA2_32221_c0_seq1:143-2164(+)
MEPPASFSAADLAAARRDVLKDVSIEISDSQGSNVFLGQYTKSQWKSRCWAESGQVYKEDGYLENPNVPKDSKCPTFVAAVLKVNNARWSGVPILMKAAKGVDERLVELRVRFKALSNASFLDGWLAGNNELVMQIQPDEALYMKTIDRRPDKEQKESNVDPSDGSDIPTQSTRCLAARHGKPKHMVVDLHKAVDFDHTALFPIDVDVTDAHERMLCTTADGDRILCRSVEEVVEISKVFAPLLDVIDRRTKNLVDYPVDYPFGSQHPPGFHEWSLEHANIVQVDTYWEHHALHREKDRRVTEIFREMNKSNIMKHKGLLDGNKICTLCRKLYGGFTPPKKQIDKIVARMDDDNDGKLSLAEVLDGVRMFEEAVGVFEGTHDYSGFEHDSLAVALGESEGGLWFWCEKMQGWKLQQPEQLMKNWRASFLGGLPEGLEDADNSVATSSAMLALASSEPQKPEEGDEEGDESQELAEFAASAARDSLLVADEKAQKQCEPSASLPVDDFKELAAERKKKERRKKKPERQTKSKSADRGPRTAVQVQAEALTTRSRSAGRRSAGNIKVGAKSFTPPKRSSALQNQLEPSTQSKTVQIVDPAIDTNAERCDDNNHQDDGQDQDNNPQDHFEDDANDAVGAIKSALKGKHIQLKGSSKSSSNDIHSGYPPEEVDEFTC